MTIMEMTVSPVSKEHDELETDDIIQIPSTSKQQNLCCLNVQRNLQIAAIQLAAQSRDRVKYEELEKRNQQMVEQMAEHNTYVESLTNQLYTMKNQLRMAEMESETAKRREVEIQKQLDLIETNSAALRKKAEASETYKNRYERAIAVCEDLQKKRLEISEHMKKLTEVAKKSKTEAESTKQISDAMKADKAAAMTKIRLYKKHVPTMLKLIDDLASKAGDLPFYTRKKIDSLASRDLRQQLLGGPVQEDMEHHDELSESDDDVNDLENLISGGVTAGLPTKHVKETIKHVDMLSAPEETEEAPRAKKSPIKTSPRKSEKIPGGRGRRAEFQSRKQHNLEETEKAFNDKLLSKLYKNEPTPIQSEIPGGHRSIHGKKGPTVREQQAKMMSVAEKVALMRSERTAEEPQPSTSTFVARDFDMSLSPVKSPRGRQRANSFDLNSDLRMTPTPEKLTPANSQESLINGEGANGAEKRDLQRLELTPSMPHLDEIEPLSPIPSPVPISTKFAVHPSMPNLEEMVQERMNEEEPPIVVPNKTRTAHMASPKKKVTFQLEEDVAEKADLEGSEPLFSKPVETIPPPSVPQPRTEEKMSDTSVSTLDSAVEGLEPTLVAQKERCQMRQSKPKGRAQQMTRAITPPNLPVKQITIPSIKPPATESTLPAEETNEDETIECKLSSPTKRALKTISSVTTELQSPVKSIPQWSQVADKFVPKKHDSPAGSEVPQHLNVDDEAPLEICFGEPDDVEEGTEGVTEAVHELPSQTEPAEVAPISVQKETAAPKRPIVNRESKLRVRSSQMTFTEDILSGAAGRTRSVPSRPSAPKRKEEAAVPIVTTISKPPMMVKPKLAVPENEKKVAGEPVRDHTEKPSPKRPTRASTSAVNSQKSLTSKMEQASKALSKRLKAASTMPKAPISKQVAPKIETAKKVVLEPATTESAEEKNDEPVQSKHNVSGLSEGPVKTATRKTKEPVRKAEMIDVAPVKRQTRQCKLTCLLLCKQLVLLKRKAADDALPPKKHCSVSTPVETLLKKVLDLDCSLDVLSKKIPAEEIEQLKTINVDTFADIVVKHVVRMKTVDMWHSVANSWKKRSVELSVNKSEENVLQIAHQLSSEKGDIFMSLTNRLMFKIYCHPNMDAALCHRIVRLLAMCFQAKEQIDEDSDGSKERLRTLVKFLARKRATLLGKSIVYLVNRLPFHFVEFLAKEEWKDVRRILVLYSEEETLKIVDTYWEAKSTFSLNLPKKDEVYSWILNELAVASIHPEHMKFEQYQLAIDGKLNELLQLRSVGLMTPKTFPSAIQESRDLFNQIEAVLVAYKAGKKSDNIVSSIFGGRPSGSDFNDPDIEVSKEVALRSTALLSLLDSVFQSQSFIGRDKTRLFLENLTGIINLSHDVLVILSERTDSQSESRIILAKSLTNLLAACYHLPRSSSSALSLGNRQLRNFLPQYQKFPPQQTPQEVKALRDELSPMALATEWMSPQTTGSKFYNKWTSDQVFSRHDLDLTSNFKVIFKLEKICSQVIISVPRCRRRAASKLDAPTNTPEPGEKVVTHRNKDSVPDDDTMEIFTFSDKNEKEQETSSRQTRKAFVFVPLPIVTSGSRSRRSRPHPISLLPVYRFTLFRSLAPQRRGYLTLFLSRSDMNQSLLLILLPTFVFSQLEVAENTINLHTNWKKSQNECNLYDESAYCQQIVIDQRMSLVAVSHRCSCPEGYKCPNDVTETVQATQCEYEEERFWSKCRMRCVPKE